MNAVQEMRKLSAGVMAKLAASRAGVGAPSSVAEPQVDMVPAVPTEMPELVEVVRELVIPELPDHLVKRLAEAGYVSREEVVSHLGIIQSVPGIGPKYGALIVVRLTEPREPEFSAEGITVYPASGQVLFIERKEGRLWAPRGYHFVLWSGEGHAFPCYSFNEQRYLEWNRTLRVGPKRAIRR